MNRCSEAIKFPRKDLFFIEGPGKAPQSGDIWIGPSQMSRSFLGRERVN